jgi:hypothetical protein
MAHSMSDLSRAGLAAKDAAYALPIGSGLKSRIAAALWATADQVVPEEQEPVPNEDSVLEMQIWARVSQRQRTRAQLLAIAAELDGTIPQVKEPTITESNFRTLCAELLGELQALRRAVADEIGCPSPEPSVVLRARAELAKPEPEGQAFNQANFNYQCHIEDYK